MITVKEYLELRKKNPFYKKEPYDGIEKDKELTIEYNKALIEKYPFLLPRNRWTGEVVESYNYSYTELDDLPDGWRIAWGDQICEEIKEELVKYDFLDKYRITQIKEKYGTLRWYDNGTPIGKLSEDYVPVDKKFTDDTKIKYDTDNEVLIEISSDNYFSRFYEENGEYKTRTSEEYNELNKDCITHYGIYKILERCKINWIISKYEKLSAETCIKCGKQDVPMYESKGWINYLCKECAQNLVDINNADKESDYTLKDFFYSPEELKD